MKKGGYIIIDLKNFNYDYSHGNKVDGLYNLIKENIEKYRKRFILSGLVYDNKPYPDIPINVYKKGTSYYAIIDINFSEDTEDETVTINGLVFKVTNANNVSINYMFNTGTGMEMYSKEGSDTAIGGAINDVKELIPFTMYKGATNETGECKIDIVNNTINIFTSMLVAELGSRTFTGFYTSAELTKIKKKFGNSNISVSCYGSTIITVAINVTSGDVTLSNSSADNAVGILTGIIA